MDAMPHVLYIYNRTFCDGLYLEVWLTDWVAFTEATIIQELIKLNFWN